MSSGYDKFEWAYHMCICILSGCVCALIVEHAPLYVMWEKLDNNHFSVWENVMKLVNTLPCMVLYGFLNFQLCIK